MVCCLLHNYIRKEMATDPLEVGGPTMEGQADVEKGKDCLTDIVNGGWKVDNGFKAGFQREREKGMKKLLPGTDLVANPHINSKIHVWMKDYSALSDLLSKSGIGWNDSTHTIDVFNEDVWEAKKKENYTNADGEHIPTGLPNRAEPSMDVCQNHGDELRGTTLPHRAASAQLLLWFVFSPFLSFYPSSQSPHPILSSPSSPICFLFFDVKRCLQVWITNPP
ncbi:hypothetical protein ACS0TY_013198 [Phlomoides rotata]